MRSPRTTAFLGAALALTASLALTGCSSSSSTPATTYTPPAVTVDTASQTAYQTYLTSWTTAMTVGMVQTTEADSTYRFIEDPHLNGATPTANGDGVYPAPYLLAYQGGPVVRAAVVNQTASTTAAVHTMNVFVLALPMIDLAQGNKVTFEATTATLTAHTTTYGDLHYTLTGGKVTGFDGTSQAGTTVHSVIGYELGNDDLKAITAAK